MALTFASRVGLHKGCSETKFQFYRTAEDMLAVQFFLRDDGLRFAGKLDTTVGWIFNLAGNGRYGYMLATVPGVSNDRSNYPASDERKDS